MNIGASFAVFATRREIGEYFFKTKSTRMSDFDFVFYSYYSSCFDLRQDRLIHKFRLVELLLSILTKFIRMVKTDFTFEIP